MPVQTLIEWITTSNDGQVTVLGSQTLTPSGSSQQTAAAPTGTQQARITSGDKPVLVAWGANPIANVNSFSLNTSGVPTLFPVTATNKVAIIDATTVAPLGNTVNVPVTIGAGASLSGAVDLGNKRLLGIEIDPAGWTAADLSLQASPDNVLAFGEVTDGVAGTPLLIKGTGGAGAIVALNTPVQLAGIRFLKLRSGTAAVPVVQVGARTMQLICQ